MGDMTHCNYCTVQDMRRRFGDHRMAVVAADGRVGYPAFGWLYVVDGVVHGWAWEIGDSCEC